MKPIYRRCCGIDVHKKRPSVCVLPPEGQQGIVKAEKFRTFLRDLKRLRARLTKCDVSEVAMESTGAIQEFGAAMPQRSVAPQPVRRRGRLASALSAALPASIAHWHPPSRK